MPRSPTILFAGGGSLGHLVPSLAVLGELKKMRHDTRAVFVCADRREETERLLQAGYSFHVLRAPKSPRGFSLSLLAFPTSFIASCRQAKKILREVRPDVVFSKGGSVSVPVCLMAKFLRIPIVLHESDSVMSVSTKFIAKFATVICTGFPVTILPSRYKTIARHTGNPVRAELRTASVSAGKRITGFSGRRPVVMIIGGSQGSVALNNAVSTALTELLNLADIIHLTGVGKMKTASHARYFVRPSVTDDLPHLYAISDVVVSRAGAGVLSELSALGKPAIIIPLTGVAHDHQLRNAEYLRKEDAVLLLPQEHIATLGTVIETLLDDESRRKKLGSALQRAFPSDAAKTIASIVLAEASSSQIQS